MSGCVRVAGGSKQTQLEKPRHSKHTRADPNIHFGQFCSKIMRSFNVDVSKVVKSAKMPPVGAKGFEHRPGLNQPHHNVIKNCEKNNTRLPAAALGLL